MAALASQVVVRVGRQQVAPAISVVYTSRRQTSSVPQKSSTNLAAYKRGRGGRSSFSGVVATVFGASGFLGRYVVNRLGKLGSQIICPYRADPYYMKDLKLAGDLGQVFFLPYHLQDEESIRKVMKYSNVVINLVGRDWETKNFKFNDVNIDGVRRIARIARESGVEKFLHVSHLNANPEPQAVFVKGGSKYLRSKFYGEEAVREEFPEAVIMRPADIFGLEDRFIRYYANAWRRSFGGRVPLWKKGTQTIKMPVFCSNVAEGLVNAMMDPDSDGKVYECVGPSSYYLSDLIDYFYRCMRWPSVWRSPVTPFFKLKVRYLTQMPSYPIMTMDKLDREHVSDTPQGHPTLEDLGVKLMKLEDYAPYQLKPWRRHRYYEEALGEYADPTPPPFIA